MPGWTEQMVRWGDEVAVACYSGKVLVYDYLSGGISVHWMWIRVHCI